MVVDCSSCSLAVSHREMSVAFEMAAFQLKQLSC